MLRLLDNPWLRWLRLPGLWMLAAAAVLIWLKLWLVSAQPILAHGMAGHDDRLFVNLADSLLHGHWLGPWNQFTLIKGCFYPVWIAVTARFGIPLLLSQHLLYLCAVLTALAAVRPMGYRPWQLFLLGTLLWFNPATYTAHVLRVIREGIYPALTLFVVAGALGTLCRLKAGSWRALWRWLLVTALALAAFWQTREEGPWLLPLLALVPLLALAGTWHRRGWRRWSLAVACAVPLLAIPCSDWTIALKNRVAYGIPVAVEFRDHDFLAALGALKRVKPKTALPHVFVSKEARERIYAVSPTFATLKPYLEGPLGKAWNEVAHKLWPELPEGEIGGGWFVWAWRESIARTGNYASGQKAMAFYRQLAKEIDGACREGKLDCGPSRASMMPPWVPGYGKALLIALAGAVPYLVKFEGLYADPAPSIGDHKTQELFRDLTHDRVAPLGAASEHRARGWLLGRGAGTVSIVDLGGAPTTKTPILWQASPDVLQAFRGRQKEFPEAGAARFDMVVPWGASLQINTATGVRHAIPLDGSVVSRSGPEVYFALEALEPVPGQSATTRRAALKIRILNGIGRGYQLTMPILAVLALVSFLAQCARALRKRAAPEAWVMQTGLLAVLGARLVMLALIEVTSFPTTSPVYLSAAYPLLLFFLALGLREGAALLPRRWFGRGALVGQIRSP